MTKSLGRKTSAMLKFRHADTPRSAREFKRKYPAEFEALKAQTGGRDFSDEMLGKLRQEYLSPVEWTLVEGQYSIQSAINGLRFFLQHMGDAPNAGWVAERLAVLENKPPLCGGPSELIKFCVNYSQLGLNGRQAALLDRISMAAMQSGHPYERNPLYCVGWIRYCDHTPGAWIVEEVQSDVDGTRRSTTDPYMAASYQAAGVTPAEIIAIMDKIEPWHSRFFEDALGIFLERAAQAGVAVEMVDYSYKADEESPRSIYTDLPRSMGMKLSPGSQSDKLDKTWKIAPNRRRSSKRSSKRRTSKRGR